MADAPSLDSMAEAAQDTQFAQLEARLVDDYGQNRRAAVHSLVDQERHRFSDARVHTFVPILVERSVRARLSTN
ncbi:MAG TPA: hypothetical protein VFV67_01420 [Actinophytocola sp.]|uniref:three-helix bundle dimerization domain-containing protein n=1 Tax=Actinophytocola sp. TaxID=1872138 RepID=UPI002DBE3C25|nr:hypothetical protein [Actinophytocola sp.]HEU5469283.1 hypothetical protein [Actinophytocola sp.]